MLVSLWPDIFVPPPEKVRAYDLLHVDGRKVEVKTDYYDHETTPNCFMEYRSHSKPGGPWRALRDGVDLFVYFFPLPYPKAYVWDDVPALCLALDEHFVPNAPERQISNGQWAAQGFIVDRARLAGYVECMELIVDSETTTTTTK